jgi:hypothetical protein
MTLKKEIETIEIREEKQEKKEIKFLGSLRKIKGLTLFSCDSEGNVDSVDYKKSIYALDRKVTVHQVDYKPGYVYVQALNKKTAVKKFKKYGLPVKD